MKDKCFLINTRGPKSGNNLCFINSIIMAMFCYKYSPYFLMECENEFCNKFISDALCALVNDEQNINLQWLREINEEFKGTGQHDASEFLSHLVKTLNFTHEGKENFDITKRKRPLMSYCEQTYFVDSKETRCTGSNLSSDYVQVYVSDNPIDDWLNGKQDILPSEKIKITRNIILPESYALIFSITRTIGSNKKDETAINTPPVIEANGHVFFRAAVVCHVGPDVNSGHYTTFIWDGYEGFYLYDDIVGIRQKNEDEYQNEIKKNGVIFFYYLKFH